MNDLFLKLGWSCPLILSSRGWREPVPSLHVRFLILNPLGCGSGGCFCAGRGFGAVGVSEEGGGVDPVISGPLLTSGSRRISVAGETVALSCPVGDTGTRTFSTGCAAGSWNAANKPHDYSVPLEGGSASFSIPALAPLKSLVGWCSPVWGHGCRGCSSLSILLGRDKQPWGGLGPGLELVQLLLLVFNVLPLENECALQLNECLALPSSFANEQLHQPLRITRGRGGEADDWPPSAVSSRAIACWCGAQGPENAGAGRSPVGRMGRLCAAESCLVRGEGGRDRGRRQALAGDRASCLAPRILRRLPVFLRVSARKHRLGSFCQQPRTCLLSAGRREGDGAEPQARSWCCPWG